MSLQTPADLARFVAAESIRARLISDLGETPTVPAAAAALDELKARLAREQDLELTLTWQLQRKGTRP